MRVPVDEVPRRSSPSLPRISVPGAPPAAPASAEAPRPPLASAEAPLPPLEPQHTDPGSTVAELSESDLLVEESRDEGRNTPVSDELSLDGIAPPRAATAEAPSEAMPAEVVEAAPPSAAPGGDAAEEEPSLQDLGLDATALARAAADEDEPELAPEATVVTESLERSTAVPSDRPPPSTSDRPPRPTSERPSPPSDRPAPRSSDPGFAEAAEPSIIIDASIHEPSQPPEPPEPVAAPAVAATVVVVQRVARVGTPTPSEPLRVLTELERSSTREDAPVLSPSEPPPESREVSLEVVEERTSSIPEVGADEIVADELLEESAPAVPAPSKRPPRPSRPPPPRSTPSMPAVADRPRVIPSGPPPAPPAPPAASVPREPPAAPQPPPAPVAPPAAAPAAPTAPPPTASPREAPREPAPPEGPPTDPRRTGKKKGAWWEDFFNDDYLRTVPPPNPKQVRRQCDFIEQRLGLAAGATVLDVGCGLGLHAVELTRRGYVVVGLDLSLPMLSRAADEAQDQGFKINFLHADMREMSFEGAFDAVLSWGTTFGYFEDDANRTVLERMHRALKPGGLLLLDVVNRDYVVRSQPNNVWFEGDGCVVMEETQCNFITSRLHVKRTVMLDDGRQRESAYSVRLYSLHELGQMLHKSFRVVEVSGRESTPGVYFGAESPRTIVVAERRLPEAPPPRPPGPPAPPKRDADQTPPPAPPPTSDQG
ncbi:MAG: methyltransferase domain-containing protein [Sandaracinus sp.]